MSEPITSGKGATLVRLLLGRTGIPTTLCLENGSAATAYNCAWGRDFGEEWEHLSLNVSPEVEGADFEFLSAREVLSVVDPGSGDVLYRRPA